MEAVVKISRIYLRSVGILDPKNGRIYGRPQNDWW